MGAKRPSDGPSIMPIPPNVPIQRPIGDIGVGGGPGIPPKFPRGGRPPRRGRRIKAGRRMPPRGPVTGPGFPSDGPSIMPIPPRDGPRIMPMPVPPRPLTGGYNPKSGVRYTDQGVPTAVQETRRIPVQDPTLGGPPEREVPIAKERIRPITRESDPRGRAPFAPDEKGMARDRFFERVFEKADEAKQRKSMQKEERREVRQARNEERRARRMQPGEINVGNERREIGRSMIEERARRRMQPGEIDVGGEIDINAERGGRRRRSGMRRNRRGRRRDFTRRRSRMQGGRRGRSMQERAAFRDRYVSTLGGGFFS